MSKFKVSHKNLLDAFPLSSVCGVCEEGLEAAFHLPKELILEGEPIVEEKEKCSYCEEKAEYGFDVIRGEKRQSCPKHFLIAEGEQKHELDCSPKQEECGCNKEEGDICSGHYPQKECKSPMCGRHNPEPEEQSKLPEMLREEFDRKNYSQYGREIMDNREAINQIIRYLNS